MNNKILVTGDKGYIGTVLVPFLIEKGYQVLGLDTEFFSRNYPLAHHPSYTSLHKDIRHIEKIDLDGVTSIIHLAALSNDPLGEIDPEITADINYKATIRLAELAKSSGVKKFIFSSSCSVYGIAKGNIVDEESPITPLTAYAKSKQESERELLHMIDQSFSPILLRNATVYGYSPHFRNDLVVNNLITTALAYGEIKVLSDGTPWRPLIDVHDLSNIFYRFLIHERKDISGHIINVGFNENNYMVKDIVTKIHVQLPDCKVLYANTHGNDTRSYRVNFDKLHTLFPDLEQEWTLDKSIANMIMQLKQENFTQEMYAKGVFERLTTLKQLLITSQIDNGLFWKETV